MTNATDLHVQREQAFAQCRQTATMIAQTFGAICEVVVHDFTNIEHSVIYIEGNVTNRAIGNGPTDLLLRAVRSGHTEEDLYGYSGYTLDNKTLRSSSMFLRDPDGTVFGALCVNIDVTMFTQVQGWFSSMLAINPEVTSETFTHDLSEALDVLIGEAVIEIGVPITQMTRAQKIRLVQSLQEKGAFQIKKAVQIVAERVGVSRFTIYNYLTVIQ